MGLLQPGPRQPRRSLLEALSLKVSALRSGLARKSTKAFVALAVVAGLMALGAGPPPSLAIGHAIATAGTATTVSSAPLQTAVAPMVASATSEPAARAPPDGTICINDANPEALRRLPGVGEKRAKAIVDLRTRLGKLKRPEDLLRVKGLGRKRLAKIRPLLRFSCEPPATPAGDASAPQ